MTATTTKLATDLAEEMTREMYQMSTEEQLENSIARMIYRGQFGKLVWDDYNNVYEQILCGGPNSLFKQTWKELVTSGVIEHVTTRGEYRYYATVL